MQHEELLRVLGSEAGIYVIRAAPLMLAQIESVALLAALKPTARELVAEAESRYPGVKFAIAAFGSLGRLEFTRGHSDLDPMIIVDASASNEPDKNEVRSLLLTPLAKAHPWLNLDHRPHVIGQNWSKITNPDLPFPVMMKHELLNPTSQTSRQRRWQLLFESRPLAGEAIFNSVYLPIFQTESIQSDEVGGVISTMTMDFYSLHQGLRDYFPAFCDPAFLYKNHYKHWKTRYLREFFEFSMCLTIVLGYYQQTSPKANLRIDENLLRASTLTKLTRALAFVDVADEELKNDKPLDENFAHQIEDILKSCDIERAELLLFDSGPISETGRLLQALLMTLLHRFSVCRNQLFERRVSDILNSIDPASCPVRSGERYPGKFDDHQSQVLINNLERLQLNYLQYMTATAKALIALFTDGSLWTADADPPWLTDALEPWTRIQPPL